MSGVSNANLFSEIRTMREEVNTRIDKVQDCVHALDTKLAVHITQDDESCKKLEQVWKEVYGNGNKKGLKAEADVWFEDHKEKKADKQRFVWDIKQLVVAFLINTGLAVLLAKIIP